MNLDSIERCCAILRIHVVGVGGVVVVGWARVIRMIVICVRLFSVGVVRLTGVSVGVQLLFA